MSEVVLAEFETLRDEVRDWQSRRFSLLGISAVLITAFIGWVIQNSQGWAWATASLPVILISTGSCFLTSHCGKMGVRASTYLQVFHRFKWQDRLDLFRQKTKVLNVNHLLAFFYLAIVLSATTVLYLKCQSPSGVASVVVLCLSCILFACSQIDLLFHSAPNAKYVASWKNIMEEELAQQSVQPDSPASGGPAG